MKDVPARTCTAHEFGLDLGEQTLNAKGGGLFRKELAPLSNAQARRCSRAYDLLTRKSIGATCSTATGSRLDWFARVQLGCAPQIIQRKRSKCFGDGRRGRLAGKLQTSFGELLVVLPSTACTFHKGSMSDLRFRQVVLVSPVFLDVSRSPNGGVYRRIRPAEPGAVRRAALDRR
jgi:hypothetical protein